MFRLIARNLLKHPLRSFLTLASMVVALVLICLLRSIVTTMEGQLDLASARRLVVQSAVSLFQGLPMSYEPKITSVPGVLRTCKWQWFGGYYQDRSNFFAQFAIDPETIFEIYPEMLIADGSVEAFRQKRTSCVIGSGLASQFGWKVGDKVPIVGVQYPLASGEAWEFEVAAIYEPKDPKFDPRMLLFHWKYFEESMPLVAGAEPGAGAQVGTWVVEIAPGVEPSTVMREIDERCETPVKVQTTTEAEFNRQFLTMVGNLPRFLAYIGTGVFLAILLACVNTMLMTAREQVRDVGILKALGFTDSSTFGMLLGQSLLLCLTGGAIGIALALLVEGPIAASPFGRFFPGFSIPDDALVLASAAAVFAGLVSGLVPAFSARRLKPIEALRVEE